MAGEVRIGISGWRYAGWRGVFYPEDLPQRRELEYAASRLASLEINGSFYSLQPAASWRAWRDQTPESFVFAVKGSRFITHFKQLKDARGALANFFASGLLQLGPKLGPILWQLPPRTRFDPERLEEFLSLLPHTTASAEELAREHDERVKDPAVERVRDAPIRHALEVRHDSFLVPELAALLRRHGVALVIAETAATYPFTEELTADFVYIRLHGAEGMYAGSYSDDALDWWAARIRRWAAGGQPDDARTITPRKNSRRGGRDVYAYFDNDQKVRAPFDALRLIERTS